MNLFALGALVAAALSSGARAQEAEADAAVVYILRPHELAWFHRSASISVDDVKAGPLANNSCAELRLPPGEHKLSVGWPAMWITLEMAEKPVELVGRLEAGRRYAARFEVETRICNEYVYNGVCREYRWRLTPLPGEPLAPKKCKVYTPLPLSSPPTAPSVQP